MTGRLLAHTPRRRHNHRVNYRGRFAPSPTGALHFGSLVAALAGWLDARAAGGEWLLRIEDLDTPRNRPGAVDAIRRTLERLGLAWDGEIRVQSREIGAYRAALDALIAAGHAYPCTCTRTEVAAASTHAGIEGPAYPGTCRRGLPPGRGTRAWRVRVDDRTIAFDDRIRGRIEQHLERDVGDFVVRLQFRLPPGGNNGLAIRYPGSGDPAYAGVEVQVLDDTDPKYATIKEWQAHGSVYGLAPSVRGYLRPVGEWNFEEVTVRGSRITVELNGSVIVDADLKGRKSQLGDKHVGHERTEGRFGFCGHGDPVAFRAVQVKRL